MSTRCSRHRDVPPTAQIWSLLNCKENDGSAFAWDVLPTAQIRSLLNCKENDRSAFSYIYQTSPSPPSRKRSRYQKCFGRNLVYSPCRCSECRWRFVTSTTVIYDKIESVRADTVRLLLCIKNTPSIKYYHHVVPVDHLTPRIEEEGRINPYNAVASGLMALMLNAIALSPFSRINPYNNSERKKTLLPMTESLLLSSQEERKSRIEEERQERI
jgi:hypothetical protein